jgi:hypothetical protein
MTDKRELDVEPGTADGDSDLEDATPVDDEADAPKNDRVEDEDGEA